MTVHDYTRLGYIIPVNYVFAPYGVYLTEGGVIVKYICYYDGVSGIFLHKGLKIGLYCEIFLLCTIFDWLRKQKINIAKHLTNGFGWVIFANKTYDMKELMIILIIIALGTFAFLVFGMTMGKKAKYDFDLLEKFVDECHANNDNRLTIVDELMRLKRGGLIPTEEIDRLTRKIVKKFR